MDKLVKYIMINDIAECKNIHYHKKNYNECEFNYNYLYFYSMPFYKSLQLKNK